MKNTIPLYRVVLYAPDIEIKSVTQGILKVTDGFVG